MLAFARRVNKSAKGAARNDIVEAESRLWKFPKGVCSRARIESTIAHDPAIKTVGSIFRAVELNLHRRRCLEYRMCGGLKCFSHVSGVHILV